MFTCLEVLCSQGEHDFMPLIHSMLMVLMPTNPAVRTLATPPMNVFSVFGGPLDSVPHCIAPF